MPIQVYHCPKHGEIDVITSFRDDVAKQKECPECGRDSGHIIKPPAGIVIARTWNDNANEWQRDPYTQAKAQATNMQNEQKNMGVDVPEITEEGLQVSAERIHREEIATGGKQDLGWRRPLDLPVSPPGVWPTGQ